MGIANRSIREIYLVGSQIRNYNAASDVDILVVTEEKMESDAVVAGTFEISRKSGKLLHPIVLSKEQLAERKDIQLYQEMTADSICLFCRDKPLL